MTDNNNYNIFEEKFLRCFNAHFGEDIRGMCKMSGTHECVPYFYALTEYLLSENEKYNLTSIKNIDEIILKHYIDSLMPLKYFEIPENSKIIDIGTGAGFPALPLAIMREDLCLTFLDSANKKINFIKNALEKIRRDNRDYLFHCGRAEELGRDIKVRETYDFAVSRAVARLNVLCELAAPFIKPGGYFIAYKSKNAPEEISEAANALKILDLKIDEIKEFELGEDKRVLIKIKKLKNTSTKYARNFSNITKNPL